MNANIDRHPFRKVVRVEECTTRYNRIGEGSYHFFLECGHDTFSKMSNGRPTRKRCRECHYQR
jgi:hypothetical protein